MYKNNPNIITRDDGGIKKEPPKLQTIVVPIIDLKPHPKNYRTHGPDQLEHIIASIKQNGIYKNVVVAKDNTLLAGHGVVEACKKMGLEKIPVIRLDIKSDSKQAWKILAGDNEISKIGGINNKMLAEIFKDLVVDTDDLLGTGYDEMLANALIGVYLGDNKSFDANEEWAGMPEYELADKTGYRTIIVHFHHQQAVEDFVARLGIPITDKTKTVWLPATIIEKAADKVYEAE